MFKSSENLRLAAEMRALERVARPWREARVSWFDGTPESIEARLAATERVLTHARAGYTTAHMALEREASTARAELKEASHRLLQDFLDDGARAFKGSKRVAGKHDADPDEPWKNEATGEETTTEHWEKLHLSPFDDVDDYEGKHRESSYREAERGLRECVNCGGALSGEEDDDKDSDCLTCGKSAHEKSVDWRKKSYRTAGEYDEGVDNLSRYLGDRLLNPEQFHRNYTNEDGEAGIPGGWPTELRKHLNDPYSAGYAASGHGPYLNHNDSMDAAGNDFYNARGQGESSFNDGWLDYASNIPHKYNDPEGHAAYHADMNGH